MSLRNPAKRIALFVLIAASGPAAWSQRLNNPILDNPRELPYGIFPHVDSIQENDNPNSSLKDDVKDLGIAFRETVQSFAARRNFNCLGRPCLVQAFPLLYSRPNSGFFGGIRGNVRDISRQEPPHWILNGLLIRSDTNQWISFAALDFPRIDALPFRPRFKLRGAYNRSTETRYFGIGRENDTARLRPDEDLRFGLEEKSFHSSLIVPAFEVQDHRVSLFGSFDLASLKPSRFQSVSVLFESAPLGLSGGKSASLALGLLVDSRDRENFPRNGWALEIAGSVAGNPSGDFPFQRFSVVDRRYFSHRKSTFAFRTTLDSLWGEVPFWELEKVGGIDPLRDISGSAILRGFRGGRFHERFKLIESTEWRVTLNPRRIFGQYTELTIMPLGIDVAQLGVVRALSVNSGIDFYFNRSFLMRFYVSRADSATTFALGFDQEF